MATQTDAISGLGGSVAQKPPVRLASSGNLTLVGEQTIDGVAAVSGDRILVREQIDGAENGIWIVQSGAWVRAPDFNDNRDAVAGTMIFVLLGTSFAASLWYVSNSGSIDIGTTQLTFNQFADLTPTAFASALFDDSNATEARATLGIVNGDLARVLETDTVATLTALDKPATNGTTYYVKGRITVGDTGGGHFRWDASSVLVGDGGTVFAADAGGTGRWIRIRDGGPANAKWFGAVGDGVNDDTAELQAAIDFVETATTKTLFIPRGTYRISGKLVVDGQNVTVRGDGDFVSGTVLDVYGATTSAIEFNFTQHSGIENIYIRARDKMTSGFAVTFTNQCFECFLHNVRIDYFYDGVFVLNCTETRILGLSLRFLVGVAGIFYGGTADSTGSFGITISDIVADCPYPLPYGPVKTWAQSTAYSLNDIVVTDNIIWQCSTAGTSAASGSGPAGVPGTNSLNVHSTEVVDGSAAWRFVSRSQLIWIAQDSFGYSSRINNVALINGGRGFDMRDGVNNGSSYPIWAFVQNMEIDHPMFDGVRLLQGEGFYGSECWFGSSLAANGMFINDGFRGEVSLMNSRIMGNDHNGILLNEGPLTTIITGNFIGDNSQEASATYHGVNVAPGASEFVITSNVIGDLVGVAGNIQGYGVIVNVGSSDHYVVGNNLTHGNVTGGVIDGGTGTDKSVTGNVV